MPHSNPKPRLNPQDLFEFLDTQKEYPVSGVGLAQRAREQASSPELVEFFESIPITFNSESEIVAHAIKPNELPRDLKLDLDGGEATPPEIPLDEATLQISDIREDRP